jgi:hypothetical protein
MSQNSQGDPLGEELSWALLRVVDNPAKVDRLRENLCGLSHRCRNSLNALKLGFYLSKRESSGEMPPLWSDLEQTYDQIERLIDRLQTIYRPMSLTLVKSCLGPMIAEREVSWRLCFAERGKSLEIDRPRDDHVGQFDPSLLGQGLDTLVSWRAEVAPEGTKARFAWCVRDGRFEVEWTELPQPSFPADESRPESENAPIEGLRRPVDSLALPLLARIIGAHAGSMRPNIGPPLSLNLNWPLGPSSSV